MVQCDDDSDAEEYTCVIQPKHEVLKYLEQHIHYVNVTKLK